MVEFSDGFQPRIDDDGCLGMVNNTPGFDATNLAEKCPDVKNLTSGMYKHPSLQCAFLLWCR